MVVYVVYDVLQESLKMDTGSYSTSENNVSNEYNAYSKQTKDVAIKRFII